MNSTRCKLCRKSSIRLERKDRKHIIDKHFHLTNVDGISSFYRDISLRMVFETFKAKLRDGILEEGDYHPSRNMIYYCPLDFVVGSSPTRRGRHRTRYVRVACTRSICPYCDHNVTKLKRFFQMDSANRSLTENETYGAKIQGSGKNIWRTIYYY